MKPLQIPFLPSLVESSSLEEVSAALDPLEKHSISNAPWPAFPYKPKVAFSIAHIKTAICLQYQVEEGVIKATYHQTDDPVFKDSCVEFFLAFNGDEVYYNLEVNPIGTCKLNVGGNRHDRIVVGNLLVETIRSLSVIKNAGKGIQWKMTLMIPGAVFSGHSLADLSGQSGNANFYKCGDDLPTPHYLCWNPVDTPEPDFHVRRCFGPVSFL